MLRFLFVTGLILAALFGLYVYWSVRDLPDIDKMVREGVNPSKWTQVLAKDGTPILSYGKFHHKAVTLNQVSPYFIDALLATEDRRYYQHFGIDPIGIVRAVFINTFSGHVSEGASTLTQQLAKNVFLSNERSLRRKIREAVLAVKLEQELTKQEILELYVNNIYFGEGAYGIRAASEVYFQKTPDQLTVDEASLLAGLPQAPSRFNPYLNATVAKKRRNEVIENLYETHHISEADMKAFQARPLRVNQSGRQLSTANRAPYFNQYLMQQIETLFGLDEQRFWQSGMKIYTTLDIRAQRLAQRAIDEQFSQFGMANAPEEVALVTFNNKTGAVLAYVGGRNYQKSQFDRVRQAVRSPGSLFKIFTYTAAVEHGYRPDRVYLDEPIQAGDWTPQNYDKKHHGYMTLVNALVHSNNIIAVKVLQEITPAAVVEVARRMGIQSTLSENLALTLGGSGVTLFEITSAIGVLGNEGERAEPYAIEKIVDRDGKTMYEHFPMSRKVLDRNTVDTMVTMMEKVITQGTGAGANIGRPAAGKTGTSDEHRDGWFVGFTPDITTGIWVGRDDNKPTSRLTGGSLPASIWRSYHQPYLASRPVRNFNEDFAQGLTPEMLNSYNIENISEYEANNPLSGGERPLPPGESVNDLQVDPLLQDEANTSGQSDAEVPQLAPMTPVPQQTYLPPPPAPRLGGPASQQAPSRQQSPSGGYQSPPSQLPPRPRLGSQPVQSDYFSRPRQAQGQQQ